jgi:2-amino-4-hydroxy-6-hydroxymethyldihydropteridine diphosphokinase
MPEQVLLTLGSNIDRAHNLLRAIAVLRQHAGWRLLAVSPFYETAAVGGSTPQAAFWNAAALIETGLTPGSLRTALREVERSLGRLRTNDKYAPRPIDLDIALYGSQVLLVDGHAIPDPDVARFPHLAIPLADVAADWVHPVLGLTLRQIAEAMTYSPGDVIRVEPGS